MVKKQNTGDEGDLDKGKKKSRCGTLKSKTKNIGKEEEKRKQKIVFTMCFAR